MFKYVIEFMMKESRKIQNIVEGDYLRVLRCFFKYRIIKNFFKIIRIIEIQYNL